MPATSELLQKGRYRFEPTESVEPGSTVSVQAYDTVSETNVCVKEITVRLGKVTTLSQQENSRVSFENAARRLTDFRHASLHQVKDFYSEVGRQYLVLEDLDGDDFQTLMAKNKRPFAVEDIIDWADQLLDAINYLHNQSPGVLHKNISPRNVKLSPAGKVKLLGVAVADDSGNLLSTALGEPDDGVLNYSPLELIWDGLDSASQKVIVSSYDERSEKVLKEMPDVRSDIYSLGATLYQLLTAKMPIDPLERSIELLEGNKDPLNAPSVIDPRVAPEISDVIMRALEIKRENRYDSATIMRQVLRTAVVRLKEREAAEAQEMEEAAEFLRGTQKLTMPAAAHEPTAPERSEAEVLAQKLREAEEMRIEAEHRAAEAERLLREREAEEKSRLAEEFNRDEVHISTETAHVISKEDDLLGLISDPVPSVHTSNPPRNASQTEPDEDIHLSVKPEPRAKIDLKTMARRNDRPEEKKVEPAVEAKSAAVIEQPEIEDRRETATETESFHVVNELKTETKPTPSISSYESENAVPEFATPKSGLPMPMLAGVAALIIVAAVAGYLFLGGSRETPPAELQPVQTQNAAVPAAESQPAELQPDGQRLVVQPDNALADTPTDTNSNVAAPVESKAAPKPVQATKAAKPTSEPAKTPAAKKAVTADDLINDN